MQTQVQFLNMIQHEAEDILDMAKIKYPGLSVEELNWKPGPKQWSVGEVFDHIINSNKDYIISVEKGITAGTPLNGEDVNFRHTLLGSWMINQIGPEVKKKIPTPKIFRPSSSNVDVDVINRWFDQHKKIIAHIERAKSINISQVKIYSPVTKLLRFNLGDVFGILVYHTQRHINQIERVKKLYQSK